MTLKHVLIGAAVFSSLVLFSPATHAQVTDAQVQATIERFKEALYKLQNERGTWDPEAPAKDGDPNHHITGWNYGGQTALAVYALITAGESYQSPRLERAIKFLTEIETKGTYAVGLRNHVWAHMPPKFEKYMKNDTQFLIEAIGGGPEKGGYTYVPILTESASPGSGGGFDNSNTQYGVLGAWEGAKRGLNVPDGYWEAVARHFIHCQEESGGWSYTLKNPAHPTNMTMTASGLACLYIAQDYLNTRDYQTPGKAKDNKLQQKINRGLEWFDKNFQIGGSGYLLVGIERVALASGSKYFGGKDWYETGANILVRVPTSSNVELSFFLIFLSRGRVPVFVNKLSIPDYDWANRPRDMAKLASWVSDQVEKEMNWQVVDSARPPEDWLDAPILYISGHEALKISPELEQKLKRYIDLGGMIITTADNSEPAFTKSVTELYEKLYPQYKLEKISDKDELMQMTFPLTGNKLGAQSLHNGVRHLAIHIPKDVSWTFHADLHTDEVPWYFFTNAYFYATEKGQARPRLYEHFTPRRPAGGGAKHEIARVRYEGNWNPEPLAWEQLSNKLFNAKKADITVKDVDMKDLASSGVKFAHLAGVDKVKFSDEEIEALKAYVNGGGVILIETAGGRGEFSQEAMKLLTKTFEGSQLRSLGTQSPLINGQGFGGQNVSKVDYRAYTLLQRGKFNAPRLQAISLNGEPRIIISNEDLSIAMLDRPLWGVFGYGGDSAQKIMSNLVLWSYSNRATPGAPATPPAATAAAPSPATPAPAAPAPPAQPVATPPPAAK